MNKTMKKVVTGALVGVMTLSMAGMAFADNQVQSIQKIVPTNGVNLTQEQRQETVKGIFDQAVITGIITQEQEDKLLEKSFINLSAEERKVEVENRLAEAVISGKMTQEQADKLLEKMSSNKNKSNKGDRPSGQDAFNKGDRPNKENKGDMKSLSQEERKAQMEEKLAEAVERGKMTQEQADKIQGKMLNNENKFNKGDRQNKGDMKNLSEEERKAQMEEKLAKAVESGKMTQEQADKILERSQNGDKIAMNRSPVKRLLEKGVKGEVITQAQADEILKIAIEK